jgi:hypothetical protein
MKAIPLVFLPALILVNPHGALGQHASFELANLHSPLVNAPIFNAQGVPLAGSNYLAELWGAATPDSLTPLVLFPQGGREIVPFLSDGYFIPTARSGVVVVPAVPGYGWAWLQVRAWDANLGATYEEVVLHGMGGYGESRLFYAQGGNPSDSLGLPGFLIGLESFSLRAVVPEPSTVALMLAGLPLLLLHHLWKRKRTNARPATTRGY